LAGKRDFVLFQQPCRLKNIVDLEAEPTYAKVMQCWIAASAFVALLAVLLSV
jgi:hypothetical protein